MKILHLRFCNLHSLRGEWNIDFSHGPLSNHGIFAIVGPTGAGKTTVLDAITLALFGRVARYGKDSPDHVMSRHTGECWAEVEFRCATGEFRCRWERMRARRKPGMNLQPPKRILSALPSGEILTEKSSETDAKILELTGLDRDRFGRSVMLAQGDFAAFLQAPAKERTELLERITGTRNYSEISKAAHETKVQAERTLKELQQQSESWRVPSESEHATLIATQRELTTTKATGEQRLTILADHIRLSETFLTLKTEKDKLSVEMKELAEQTEKFLPRQNQLNRHQLAQPSHNELKEYALLSTQSDEKKVEIKVLSDELPQLEVAAAEATKSFSLAEQSAAALKAEEDAAQLLWQQVISLDEQLTAKAREKDQAQAAHDKATDQSRTIQELVITVSGEMETSAKLVDERRLWLQTNAADLPLQAALPNIQEAITAWFQNEESSQKKTQTLSAEEALLAQEREKITKQQKSLAEIIQEVSTKKSSAEKASAEFEEMSDGRSLAEWETAHTLAQMRLVSWNNLARMHEDRIKDRATHEDLHNKLDKARALLKELAGRAPLLTNATLLATDAFNACRELEATARVMQSLTEHRHQLIDGHPCPLCGALEHPLANDSRHPSEILNAAERQREFAEKKLRQQEQAQQDLDRLMHNCMTEQSLHEEQIRSAASVQHAKDEQWRKQCASLGFDGDSTEESFEIALASANSTHEEISKKVQNLRHLSEAKHAAAKLVAEAERTLLTQQATEREAIARAEQSALQIETLRKEILELDSLASRAKSDAQSLCAPFSPQPDTSATARTLLASLHARAAGYTEAKEALQSAIAKQETLQATLTGHKSNHQTALDEVEKYLQQTAKFAKEASKLSEERIKLFGDTKVEDARATMLQRREANAKTSVEARTRREEADAALVRKRDLLTTAQKALDALQEQIQKLQTLLRTQASQKGFTNIEALQSAILPEEDAEAIRQELNELNSRKKSLSDRQQENTTAFAALPAKAAEGSQHLASLHQLHTEYSEKITKTVLELGAVNRTLETAAQAEAARAKLIEPIAAAEKDCLRWTKLANLIGSANGQAFAQFAQSLTLDRLVTLANRHLALLTPRYSLRRVPDMEQQLELEIVDYYQAEAIRPMNTLSGGETFLASLAMALGLSELASQNAPLESLFIDEGFGSLDADTLDLALAALDRLRSSGKCIGLISHLDAIKDRITAKIIVTPVSSGSSRLEIVT